MSLSAPTLRVAEMGATHHAEALAFLRARRETSLFLLGNLADQGDALTAHPNSGTYRVVLDGDRLIAVFVLTRRGTLLAQSDDPEAVAGMVLDACEAEGRPIEGINGAWPVAETLWRQLGVRQPSLTTPFQSREVLYRWPGQPVPAPDLATTRPLTPADFDRWEPLNRHFGEEAGIPAQGTLAQRRTGFETYAGLGRWWGRFVGGELVSLACLNACVEGLGQVGGVYTPPEHRRMGHSRATLERLMADATGPLGLHTLILFTGETNHGAQAMYEGLGFERIGHYGLFFVQDAAPGS